MKFLERVLAQTPGRRRVPPLMTRHLRRRTALPTVVPTCATGRYLQRLVWLFGGS